MSSTEEDEWRRNKMLKKEGSTQPQEQISTTSDANLSLDTHCGGLIFLPPVSWRFCCVLSLLQKRESKTSFFTPKTWPLKWCWQGILHKMQQFTWSIQIMYIVVHIIIRIQYTRCLLKCEYDLSVEWQVTLLLKKEHRWSVEKHVLSHKHVRVAFWSFISSTMILSIFYDMFTACMSVVFRYRTSCKKINCMFVCLVGYLLVCLCVSINLN